MVCHIPVEMWRRGVTPTFPGVASGYRAMPRCTPPRIRTGKSPQSECGAFANLTRGALDVSRIEPATCGSPPAGLSPNYHYDDL